MPKLLVVTPPGPNADVLATTLSDHGYTVCFAPSGAHALPAAIKDPPDVVLMDSALSAMDRWHAVKRMNSEPRTSRIPVLTLASDAHSPAGIQRVLSKLVSTLGPAQVTATPVAASTRVVARRGPSASVLSTMPAGVAPPVRSRDTDSFPTSPKVRLTGTERVDKTDSLDTGLILVVDDNDLNRDMLSRRLRRRGYEVKSAEDGAQALEMIKREKIELVLLDWMMPGMSGFEVLQHLRQRYSPVELPVIMATAKTEADDIVQALRANANDYVTKPLNFDVVHARIRTQLSLSRAHSDLLQSERRYRVLLENTGDMIVQFGLDGTVFYVSPASRTLLGYEPEVLRRRSWYENIQAIDRRELLAQQSAASLPTNYTYIARMPRSDGQLIWVETSCRVVRDQSGEIEMIQAACRDVTEHVERVTGDEPPLPLGGDIMEHPGWRHTGEPPPPRTNAPSSRSAVQKSVGEGGVRRPSTLQETTVIRTPIVIVGSVDGLDAEILQGMTEQEIGQRVISALRTLSGS